MQVHGKNLFYFFSRAADSGAAEPVATPPAAAHSVVHIHFGMSGAFKTMRREEAPKPAATTRLRLESDDLDLIAHLSAMTVDHGDDAFYQCAPPPSPVPRPEPVPVVLYAAQLQSRGHHLAAALTASVPQSPQQHVRRRLMTCQTHLQARLTTASGMKTHEPSTRSRPWLALSATRLREKKTGVVCHRW